MKFSIDGRYIVKISSSLAHSINLYTAPISFTFYLLRHCKSKLFKAKSHLWTLLNIKLFVSVKFVRQNVKFLNSINCACSASLSVEMYINYAFRQLLFKPLCIKMVKLLNTSIDPLLEANQKKLCLWLSSKGLSGKHFGKHWQLESAFKLTVLA